MTLSKATFRKNSLEKLKNRALQNSFYKSIIVNKKLLKLLKSQKRKKILFYYPLEMEVNILKVLYFMRKRNDVYIPFMQGQSFKMVSFRLPLHKKRFGIYEAGNSLRDIKKIDIAIVPVVGVDGNLQRVGFGKGMYDRFFETLEKRPYTIFIQREFCYTKELVCDTYDIDGDILLTPFKDIRKNRC